MSFYFFALGVSFADGDPAGVRSRLDTFGLAGAEALPVSSGNSAARRYVDSIPAQPENIENCQRGVAEVAYQKTSPPRKCSAGGGPLPQGGSPVPV